MGTMFKATIIYIIGCIALCGYAGYFLFYQADSAGDYALWIVLPLAWVISYFPIVTPMVTTWRFKQVFDTLKDAKDIKQAIEASDVSDEEVIELIQTHSDLPGPVVDHLYPKLKQAFVKRMSEEQQETK